MKNNFSTIKNLILLIASALTLVAVTFAWYAVSNQGSLSIFTGKVDGSTLSVTYCESADNGATYNAPDAGQTAEVTVTITVPASEYSLATTKTATLSYTFKDGAGNSHICSRNVDVYVDRTKPTCTWDGESTSWRSSATIKATCSDYIDGVSGSGCAATTPGTSWLFASTLVKTSDLSYNITDVVGNAATCTKTANVYVGQVPTNLKVIKHTQTSYCSGGVKYEGTNVEKPTNSSNAVIVQIAATNATYYQICTSATAGCVTINKVTGNCASWGGTGASTVGQASYEDNLGYRWARACNDVGCTGTTRFYVK